jgi:hypothetical protein
MICLIFYSIFNSQSPIPRMRNFNALPLYKPNTIFGWASAEVTITYMGETRVAVTNKPAGIFTVIIADFLTCALVMFWFLATIYMPIIRAYLSLVFTDMGEVASFAEIFVVAFSITSSMFTAVLLRDLMPFYGPNGNLSADILTVVETAWKLVSGAN